MARGTGNSRGREGKTDQRARYLWRNMLFRNLGAGLSSDLIREATSATYVEWQRRYGELPEERLRTEVGIKEVHSNLPGYCYMRAGWKRGETKRGKLFLYAPKITNITDLTTLSDHAILNHSTEHRMPRPRKPKPDPAQLDIVEAAAAAQRDLPTGTPADLVKAHQELRTWADAQTKAFNEHMAPYRQKLDDYTNALLKTALEQKVDSFKTEFGTAYISRGFAHKVDPNAPATYTNPETGEVSTGREALLDWMLDNWNDYGAEWASVNIAIDGVKAYIEKTKTPEHPEGLLPPGISIERWQRLQIRKA